MIPWNCEKIVRESVKKEVKIKKLLQEVTFIIGSKLV
jgi:hypothetical protein